MPPKRTSTSEAPAMTQAAIKKLVADSVSAALEVQAANMANTDNTTRPRQAPVARKCSYKEFMSCQPINFKGTEGVVGLICWFERTESMFSSSNCTEYCKIKFATGTLTKEALSWWNSFAQPIGIEEAYKITWGNDLKTYVRRFQELATLCPTMVPDSEKMMEVFIGGLPRSIEGNVTTSKPQTLEEAINIAQRLMDQVGHLTKNCKNKGPATGSNLLPVTVTCHAYSEKGHWNLIRQDNTNVVNAPREPFVVKHNPGENSSPSLPQIDHCCHECGDSLDEIFCRQCTCKSCGKGAHYGYNCPPKVPIITDPEPCNTQTISEPLQNLQSLQQQCLFRTYQNVPYPSEICGNDSHYGYDCHPQVPFVYNQDPCFNQNFDYFPQTSPSFPQQYLCCENCGGPHETFQCQPMNEDYYHEQNSCYDSNSFGFDQFQPPQYTVNHPIFNSQNELLNSQNKLMEQMTTLRDLVGQAIQKKEEEKRIAEEQAAKERYWKIPICDDDDEDNTTAITPVLPIEEPDNSLSMGDEHLDTIPTTESDEVIKSSVEDLVPIPSESEGIPDKMCDVPLCANTTPLNALNEHSEIVVNSDDDNSSSDDDSPYGGLRQLAMSFVWGIWKRTSHQKTENTAKKMTKPDMEWKSCEGQSQSKAKDQKSQSQKSTQQINSQTGAVIEEYYWMRSHPSDGPGKLQKLESRSHKKSLEMKKNADVLIINDGDEEEESAADEFILSPRTHIASLSLDKETLQEFTTSAQDDPLSSDNETLKELTASDPTPSSSTP
ncbi:hypothetical protein Tco_0523687 [Tanacetum coccineum]